MPDAHQGYGFPIGGVAAFDPDQGVVSPGGVGYDINCGVRLLRSRLPAGDLSAGQLTRLADDLAAGVPAGVGRGSQVQLSDKDMDQVLARGRPGPWPMAMATPATWSFARPAEPCRRPIPRPSAPGRASGARPARQPGRR